MSKSHSESRRSVGRLVSRMGRWWYLAALALLVGRNGLAADASAPSITTTQVDHWGTDDGFRQATVTATAIDDNGDLWVGTFGGLHRFDGLGVNPVMIPAEQQGRLARVSALTAVDGVLWVAFLNQGLWMFDGSVFTEVSIPDELKTGLIWDLEHDGGGGLIITSNQGVLQRDASGAMHTIYAEPALDCVRWGDQRLAIATDDQVVVVDADGARTTAEVGTSVYGLVVDPGGNLWVQTLHGLQIWLQGQDGLSETPWRKKSPLGVSPVIDLRGHVWLPARDGVHDLGPWEQALAAFERGTLPEVQHHPLGSLPRSMMLDPAGQLWVGTMGDGLNRISEQEFVRYSVAAGDARISLGPIVGQGEDVWTAYDCSKVVRFRSDGRQEVRDLGGLIDSPGLCIRGLTVFSSGQLALGWTGDVRIETASGWTSLDLGDTAWFPNEEVVAMQVDDQDRLWFATSHPRVFRRDPDSTVHSIDLPSDIGAVWSFEFAGEDVLVGSDDGIVILQPGEAPRRYRANEGLPYGPIRDIALGEDGILWMVSYGGGIGWLVDGVAGRLGPEVSGMPDGFLSSVVPDKQGGIWIHGNRGLYRIRRRVLDAVRAGDQSAMVSERVGVGGANGWNRPAHWVSASGDLWLVTLNDLVRFPLDSDLAQEVPGLTQVFDIRVQGATFRVSDEPLVVPARLGRSIELRFSAPALGANRQNRYEHRLRFKGEESAWSEAQANTTVNFARLAPGSYRFEVRAVGLDGAQGPVGSAVFEIPMQWHEDRRVWLGLFALGVLGFAVLVAVRLSALGGRNRMLEREIEQRRSAEDHARTQERQYRELFEAAGHALLLFSDDGICTDANEEAERIFQANVEELVGLSMSALGLDGTLRRSIDCRRPNGTRFPARIATTRHTEGGRERWLFSVVDLSELLEARESERRLRGQLESARRIESLGRLAGGVAHDMNNLLAAIIGNAELIAETNADPDSGGVRDPELAEGIDEILDASARGARLIEQLMSMGRRDSAPPSNIPVDPTLRAMESMLRRVVPEDVTLTVQAHSGLAVRGTLAELEQIILNLVMNASDAMGKGGHLELQATANGEPPDVVMTVSDTGEGISKEVLPTIFEPFVTSKAPGQGTGLGLATVRDIVTKFGGTVDVQSTLGVGSVFTIRLPGVDVLDAPEQAQLVPDLPTGDGEVHVLVVDDNDALRRTVVGALRGLKLRVVDFGDPVEALAWAQRSTSRIDALVTDVVMPGLDGRALADQMRESHPGLPVLFISGYTGDVVVRHGVDTEREALLRKPFSRVALAASVEALLRVAHGGGPRDADESGAPES